MENNKFNKFYSSKPVSELIGQLRSYRITGSTLDKEWYEALKTHLSERVISTEERKLVDNILSAETDTLRTEEKQEDKFKETETNNQFVSIGSERYPALRTIAGFYNALARIVGVIAVIMVVYYATKGNAGVITAVVTLIVGALSVLGILAVSESIKVVIDIEYNTRKTANKK